MTTTSPAIALEFAVVDPAKLNVRDQAREDATPDQGLIDSVKAHGIIQPPVVEANEDGGGYTIVTGHRRVGAAIVAGLTEVTVIVRPHGAATEALTLEQQIVENERRKGLSQSDLAAGYQKLSLFGLRPEDIAAQLGESKERVAAGVKAATSKAATEALASVDTLDLEQAAIIAEFEGDEAAQDELLQVAKRRPSDLHITAVSIRANRAAKEREQDLRARAEQEGVSVIAVYRWDDNHWRGNPDTGWNGRQLTILGIRPEEHTGCPGHAAILNALGNPDNARIDYVCTNYVANGHELASAPQRELTPDEIAEQERLEAEREEREQLREALAANVTHRREWLRGFLNGRINQAAGLMELIATTLLGLGRQEDVEQSDSVALLLLTGEEVGWHKAFQDLADTVVTGRATPLRALAAYAIGTCEEITADPDIAESVPHLASFYFERLVAWGYPLTEVDEKIRAAAVGA